MKRSCVLMKRPACLLVRNQHLLAQTETTGQLSTPTTHVITFDGRYLGVRPNQPLCQTCIHFELHTTTSGREPECRRYPPRGFDLDETTGVMAVWPPVSPGDWCSEHVDDRLNHTYLVTKQP